MLAAAVAIAATTMVAASKVGRALPGVRDIEFGQRTAILPPSEFYLARGAGPT
jgi:hypothetical protein